MKMLVAKGRVVDDPKINTWHRTYSRGVPYRLLLQARDRVENRVWELVWAKLGGFVDGTRKGNPR